METVNTLIIGAGVVGLAIAARLSKTRSEVLVIDKNHTFGEETSSRNSEVIHAGIYYPEKSLKARFCVTGNKALYKYCNDMHIPFKKTGKLIVAQNKTEENHLIKLMKQAKENGVNDLIWLNKTELLNQEPALSAQTAILSPSTGILDSHSFMQSLLSQAINNQALFVAKTRFVTAVKTKKGFIVTLNSQGEEMQLQCQTLINSTGLHSELTAKSMKNVAINKIPQQYWCKGHYFSYSAKNPFKRLIYPVPEENTKGLGIHATMDMAGQLKFGPDTQYINELNYNFPKDLTNKFFSSITRYFPALNINKLHPAYVGIRPKLQGPQDTFNDFSIQYSTTHGIPNLINLFGIESPGLTASLAIASYLERLLAAP